MTDTYNLKWGNESATVFVANDARVLAIVSSYGSFGYSWSRAGVPGPFSEFLVSTSPGYLTNKLVMDLPLEARRELDRDGTDRECRDWIIDSRRRGWLSAERARELWDDIEYFVELIDELGYPDVDNEWYDIDGWTELVRYKSSPRVRALDEFVVPLLKEAITKEIR